MNAGNAEKAHRFIGLMRFSRYHIYEAFHDTKSHTIILGKQIMSGFLRTAFVTGLALFGCIIPVLGQVYVGGEINGSETYDPANNPYIVIEDITITSDAGLFIMPGVVMLFRDGTSLINNGTLIAIGKPGEEIQFLPENQIDSPGQWGGIVFNNARTILDADSNYLAGSILSHTIIGSASNSVLFDYSTISLVENTTIKNCYSGIYMRESKNSVFRNCTLQNCISGIFVESGKTNKGNKIYGNTISGSENAGITINSTATHSNHNFIMNNYFVSCNVGLKIGNYGNFGSAYNFISGNTFIENNEGVSLFHHSNTITGNNFVLNRNGISLWQSNSNTITGNYFSRNELNAIVLSGGSSFNSISYNSINYSKGGVLIKPDSLRNSLNNSFFYNTVYHNTDFSFQIYNSPQGSMQFNNIGHNGEYQSFINSSDSLIHAEYNFWCTTSIGSIDSIISDMHDSPLQGEVLYQPMLNEILTTAPVPPPQKVIKQQIRNKVFLSWEPEVVSDLAGYTVHYGNTNGLAYENEINNGMNRSIFMADVGITDTIAVTARDIQADGANDQTQGYESDFSYAIFAPYAGPDTAICYNSAYSIMQATAVNYEHINWATSGDGAFSNSHVVKTKYTPGPQDYMNGSVALYLKSLSPDFEYTDTAYISFQDAPVVYAGNDTTICNDSGLQITQATTSGSIYLKWTSEGDGVFNFDTISHPFYLPGPNDKMAGGVTLICTAFSSCGFTSDQFYLKLVPGYSIHGRIHAGNTLAANSALYLYVAKDQTYEPIRSATVSSDGLFAVNSLFAGTYYLHALPDKVTSPGYLPTYYFNDICWKNAYQIKLDADAYDVDLDLAMCPIQLPKGEGSINGYCKGLTDSTMQCGNVTVFLYDKNRKNILDWAFVQNNNTGFRFRNLPFGEYVLYGEIAGIQPFSSEIITISPEMPGIEDIELVCSTAGHKFSLPDFYHTPDIDLTDFYIYPNPVHDKLFINGINQTGLISVRIINSQSYVYKYSIYVQQGENSTLFLTGLPSGIYFIEICQAGNCIHRQKLIKQ